MEGACHCGAPASGVGDYPSVCDQWPLCEQRLLAERFARQKETLAGAIAEAVAELTP